MMSFKARERELTLMTCYEIENFSRKVEARVSDRDLENRVEAAFFLARSLCQLHLENMSAKHLHCVFRVAAIEKSIEARRRVLVVSSLSKEKRVSN